MREVSTNAYQSIRDLDFKIVTNDEGAVYTSADIVSMDIQRKLTDKGVSIGNAISDRLSVTLRKSENDIPKNTRFVPYVKFGDDVNYTRLGRFYVTKCTKNKHGYLNVTCMDYLNRLDKECKWKAGGGASALTFPATHQQMLDYITSRYSLSCRFVCQNWTVETKPEGYTYRQILSFIAASHAANVHIDENDAVTFVQFAEATYPLSAANVISQMIDETVGYTVNGLYIEVDDDTDIYIDDVPGSQYDEDATGIVKVKNPFATVAIANYCWTQLGGLSYISTTITKRATTALQCGDVIDVYDYAGEPAEFKAAVTALHYTVSASGGFQEQITSYADTGENKKTTPNKKAEITGAVSQRFFSADDPFDDTSSEKPKSKDEWFVLDNDTDKHLLTIKQCKIVSEATSESEAVYEWEIVAVLSTGGGVGEEIGNHSVRFNEDTNTVTESQFYGYNILGGRDNSLTNSIKTIIDGAQNSGASVTECIISGEQNTVSRADESIISGARHNVTDDDDGIVTGRNNTTNGNSNTVTTGSDNTVSNCQNCNISGNNNTARYATNSIVTGYNNTAESSRDSITAGSGNTADQDRAITAGIGNKAVSDGLTVGRYSQYNSSNRIVIGNGNDDNNRSNAFYVMYDGTTYAKVYHTTGADYAEYFEWADGNPDNEDRRGMLVQLTTPKWDDKSLCYVSAGTIVPAHGDDIIGAVSCRASVIGNAYEEHWHGKYKTDVFGAYIPDKDGRPQLSDDYDPERKYIPRSQRQEWAAIGLVGRLIIRDNGKCEPGSYVTARQGVGAPTFKETRARCIRRLDESHIEIIVR